MQDETIYAADVEQVRALNAATGEVIWSFPAEANLREYGPFYTIAPAEEHQTLLVSSFERTGGGFFAQSRGVLRALDMENGRPLWEFAETKGEFVAAGTVGDDTFIIGNSDQNVYAFDVESGSLVWSEPFHTNGRVWATPLILSDTVYVPSLDHSLYALDLETGREKWRWEANGAIASRPLALEDRLYIGAFDNYLYALRQEDGSVEWQFEGANWIWGSPSTDGTRIYAADVDGNVYAVQAETGEEVWRSAIEEPVHLGPVVSGNGEVLLVAANTGALYGLDIDDGFTIWSQPGEGQLASLTASGDFVYVSRIYADERVQAFYADNGRLLWVYPLPEAAE